MKAKAAHFHDGFGLAGELPHVPRVGGSPVFSAITASAGNAPLVVEAKADGDQGVLLISGYIGDSEDSDNSAQKIRAKFEELEAKYNAITVVLMNCMGGSVAEGFPTYNLIKASKAKITTVVEGMAASFGAVLFAAGEQRLMAKYSKLMVHSARGGAWGTSAQMQEQVNLIKKYDDDMANVFAGLLGSTKEEVAAKWLDGSDHWLTPDDAVEAGFATGILDGKTKRAVPTAKLKDAQAVFAFYQEQFQESNKNENEMKNKHLFITALAIANAKLSITADATEEAILAEVQKQSEELKQANELVASLKTKVEAAETAKVNALVTAALDAGKITAAQKEQFEKLAKADYDSTKAILDGMKGHTSISAKLNGAQQSELPHASEFVSSTYKEIVASGEKGTKYLKALEAKDKAAFDKLKAAYNQLPG